MDALIEATSNVNQATARKVQEDFGRTKDYEDFASDLVQFLRPIMRKLPGPALAKSLEVDAGKSTNTCSDNADTEEKDAEETGESEESGGSGMREALNTVFARSVLKQYATDMLSHEEGAWNRLTKGAVADFEEDEEDEEDEGEDKDEDEDEDEDENENDDDDDEVASLVPTPKASKNKSRSTASSSSSAVASLGMKLAGAAAVA